MKLSDATARLEAAVGQAHEVVAAAGSLEELDAVERQLVGKRSPAAEVNEAIKQLPAEDRPAAGQAVGAYRNHVASISPSVATPDRAGTCIS